MSTNCSALWSSLRTLELTSHFTSKSTPEEFAEAYYDSIPEKHHKQHHKFASALAYIGATSSDSESVTACSVELFFSPEGEGNYSILLRVAQNKKVERNEIDQLQGLVDGLVQKVSAYESDWSTNDGKFFIIIPLIRYLIVCVCNDWQNEFKPSAQSSRNFFSRL
jgi:hypothetical protein